MRDHPRVRGEHPTDQSVYADGEGSSPRARGAPRRAGGARFPHGIIPACAGSTRPTRASTPTVRDHPRVRGEHARRYLSSSPTGGSSPRARGAPRGRVRPEVGGGIIPACAGSTLRYLLTSRGASVFRFIISSEVWVSRDTYAPSDTSRRCSNLMAKTPSTSHRRCRQAV